MPIGVKELCKQEQVTQLDSIGGRHKRVFCCFFFSSANFRGVLRLPTGNSIKKVIRGESERERVRGREEVLSNDH